MEEEISVQSQGVLEALSRCQKSGEFKDMTLVCEGERINVHKVVVCSQSDVLHAACTGNFKEASSGVYEFLDDSKIIVRKLVSFFYTGTYSDRIQASETEQPSCSALQLHARVFVLADKYVVKDLPALCVKKYKRRLEVLCDPIEFIESIPEVYALPPTSTRILKEVVTRFARINISNYLREETVQMAYNSVAQNVPEFVKDLLDLYIEAPLLGNCADCGQHVPMVALQGRCRRCRRGTSMIAGDVTAFYIKLVDCDFDLDLHAIWQEPSDIPTPPPCLAADLDPRHILSNEGGHPEYETQGSSLIEFFPPQSRQSARFQVDSSMSEWVATRRSDGDMERYLNAPHRFIWPDLPTVPDYDMPFEMGIT